MSVCDDILDDLEMLQLRLSSAESNLRTVVEALGGEPMQVLGSSGVQLWYDTNTTWFVSREVVVNPAHLG